MIAVVRSEWIKMRTIRMNWVLLTIAVAFPVVISALLAALNDDRGFDAQDVLEGVTGTSVVTGMLLGVVGAATVTGEFGFGTIRPTFAATPRRSIVFAAKALVTVVVAVVVEALVVVGCYLLSAAISSARDRDIDLADAPNGKPAIVGLVCFAGIVALLGFGLGLLVRNTPPTVAILLLWPLLIEGLIGGLLQVVGLDDAFKWLPYRNGILMADVSAFPDRDLQLGRVLGGLYFLGVTVAITLLGAFSASRRDA